MSNSVLRAFVCLGAFGLFACDGVSESENVSAQSELCALSAYAGDSTYHVTCGGVSMGSVSGNEDGAPGTYCSVKALSGSSDYKIVCGGDSVGVLLNGTSGARGADGSACSQKVNGDGTVTETCGPDSVTLYSSLCGTKLYDVSKQFCAGVTLYDLCNGASYNPSTEYCRASTADTAVETLLWDSRDNRLYRTVTIGTQVWMAENLKYPSAASVCYSDSLELCTQYGRLYPWVDADTVCPDGWHLPTQAEWNTLTDYVDAHNGDEGAGESLKSSSGWGTSTSDVGTDYFDFAVLPSGYWNSFIHRYRGLESSAYFWSGTTLAGNYADEILFDADSNTKWDSYTQKAALSVRCVRN